MQDSGIVDPMVDGADGALRCPTCGKGWPANHATCPDDGGLLATQNGTTVHLAETMILPGRKPTASVTTPEEAFDTTVSDADIAEVRWIDLAESDQLMPDMFPAVRQHLGRVIGPS